MQYIKATLKSLRQINLRMILVIFGEIFLKINKTAVTYSTMRHKPKKWMKQFLRLGGHYCMLVHEYLLISPC